MLNTLRRSFGMSPSTSQTDMGSSGVPAGVLSPSDKPNTFVPLRRSNSFTNFFSSSRPSSPVKDTFDAPTTSAVQSPTKHSSSATHSEVQSDPVLAFLVLLDKKGRQKETFPIQNLKTTLGRSIENDVRFLASDVSRIHCTIEIEIQAAPEGNAAFLQVLGANGVLLNGVQALPAPRGQGTYQLHSGDSIVIAKRSFLFKLPETTDVDAAKQSANLFASPVKGTKPSAAAPHTPAGPRRRVRMSLVNAAQIDTPARASRKAASPAKSRNADDTDREARRANGLQRFVQSANVSPSKAKKSGRQSLTSSTSTTGLFATPLKSRTIAAEPKTAPPKQVSFSLYANSYSGRLSPVKQMRMMPPLEAMSEEHDGSFRSDSEHVEEQHAEEDAQHDESEEDIVIVEELEQEAEAAVTLAQGEPEADNATQDSPMSSIDAAEDAENVPPPSASSDNAPAGSPSKGGSPKRAKRRSSFFGRAGPFKGMSLGFYAEERTEPSEPSEPVEAVEAIEPVESSKEPESEEAAEHFSDASDVEPEEEQASAVALSPSARRVASKHMRLGISKTPSPVKKQHFVGLTPLPRRPRLSLSTKRRVSLRTQTLLRSSEAYSDRLFLPPPPPSPATPGASGLSKSMSMPSSLSGMVDSPQPEGLTASASFEDISAAEENEDDFESLLDPALVEETPAQAWRDSDEDEDEVDQSLSVSSLSPQKPPVYNFSPVKASALPQFATPQPASKTHSRRISMPPAGASDAKPSARTALVRLQISGAGERIVHEKTRDTAVDASSSSPSKSRKVVRVSDVGLPATELSMGFDLLHDGAAEPESDRIAEALNDMFTAEEEEPTDDEQDDDDEEVTQEEVVQISSRNPSSPERPVTESAAPQPAVPQTPAALNSMRHLFSAAAAAPGTPNMNGLASMLQPSPEKTPQYGVLGERMRAANPEISAILSPSKRSPTKAALAASPSKPRRSVRRSEAAEVLVPVATIAAPPTPLATPTTPRALPSMPDLATPAVTPLPTPVAEVQPAFEAELHVTMFDAAAMDAHNEVIAQALVDSEVTQEDTEFQEDQAEADHAESTADAAIEPEAAPVDDAHIEDVAVAASPEPTHEETEVVADEQEAPAPLEPSPTKTRASRRAVSVSPTKPRTRSVSPTKRATRSSPVERAFGDTAPQPEAESAEEVATTAAEVFGKPEDAVEAEKDASESPSKATRRTGTRKAKAAASQAIAVVLEVPVASPEKRTRRTKASVAKSSEAEEDAKAVAESENEPTAEEDNHEEEQDGQEEEEVVEAPKRATRARATRTTASTTTKPARASRSRAAKASEAAHPSSSAAYGDDEASDDEAAPTTTRGKRATTRKAASSPTKPAARSTRIRTTATRTTRTKAAAPAEESDPSESSAENDEQSEQEAAPAPKTRTRAAASKPRATKPATSTTASSRSKAKPKTDDEAATTRSGRPRRAAAAK